LKYYANIDLMMPINATINQWTRNTSLKLQSSAMMKIIHKTEKRN